MTGGLAPSARQASSKRPMDQHPARNALQASIQDRLEGRASVRVLTVRRESTQRPLAAPCASSAYPASIPRRKGATSAWNAHPASFRKRTERLRPQPARNVWRERFPVSMLRRRARCAIAGSFPLHLVAVGSMGVQPAMIAQRASSSLSAAPKLNRTAIPVLTSRRTHTALPEAGFACATQGTLVSHDAFACT